MIKDDIIKRQRINDVEYHDKIKENFEIIKKEELNFKNVMDTFNIISIKYFCSGANGYIFKCKTINKEYALKIVRYIIDDDYGNINNEYRSEKC
jgi:hypothetical protein